MKSSNTLNTFDIYNRDGKFIDVVFAGPRYSSVDVVILAGYNPDDYAAIIHKSNDIYCKTRYGDKSTHTVDDNALATAVDIAGAPIDDDDYSDII
jgi:hypothetical protein